MTTTAYNTDTLVAIAEATLLVNGGVDNWEWYSESLSDAGYEPQTDEGEDAIAFLNALEAGGVDNWDWYSESLSGLFEYREYLEALPDLTQAMSIHQWQDAQATAKAEAAAEVVEPVVEVRTPQNPSEQRVYGFVAENWPDADTTVVFDKLVTEVGLWKRSKSPKDFEKAMKSVKPGTADFLEAARDNYVTIIIKNGLLKKMVTEAL